MNKEIAERIKMIKEGNVPEGYRKSVVGMIPTEWTIKKLSQYIISLSNGISVNAGDRSATKDEIGILKTSSVTINGFRPNKNKVVINDEDIIKLKIYPQKDNLIIVRKNTPELVGMVNYIDKDYKNLFLPDLLWQTIFKQECNINKKYIYYFLNTNYYNKLIKTLATGSSKSMPNIRKENLLNISICIPSSKEQDKITNILSKFDRLIELKEKLLKEKQKQKKGLMERLLSGKVRLNGFDEELKTVKLRTLMKERNEIGYNDLELLAITSANGVVRRTEVNVKDNSSEDKSKYKRILPGDIGYNTMRMWQGVSGLSKYEGIVSPAYTILKPTEKIDSEFMSYLFKLPQVVNLFHRYSQGLVSDTLNLKYENFKGIKVTIPTEIEEQKQIANILSISDKEIKILKKEIEELKKQKKGLMQLLLTGIVRVKCD
ncbi:restriction endonuclease subunit S [Clostridium sp. ZBS12]|uniref:restriction endonuclease subunit S n=1 Tax=Clostridium sp. ZBS12 TaxID=2949972 RepID=UPI0020796EF7|nr:restriction endonuclease subunit S [Clostridium sp. ZBS12]